MKKRYVVSLALMVALSLQAQAQTQTQSGSYKGPYPISQPQPSLSKAGAVQSRPSVPNRNVDLPPGARYSTNYYYNYLRFHTPQTYSVAPTASPQVETQIPGLDVRAGQSRRSQRGLPGY